MLWKSIAYVYFLFLFYFYLGIVFQAMLIDAPIVVLLMVSRLKISRNSLKEHLSCNNSIMEIDLIISLFIFIYKSNSLFFIIFLLFNLVFYVLCKKPSISLFICKNCIIFNNMTLLNIIMCL